MKKMFPLVVGAVAVIGVAGLLIHSSKPDGAPSTELATTGDGESELEKALRIASPNEDELQREIRLLQDSAGGAEAASAPPVEPDRDVASLIAAPQPPVDRGYDLRALELRLIGALQGTDAVERRTALQEIAAFLAGLDNETATRFMKAILETRDELTDSDGYAFATAFVGELSRTNPAMAAEWSEMLPIRLRYSAQQILTLNWVAANPQAAENWMQKITDDGLRASSVRMMSYALTVSDESQFGPAWAQRLAQRPEDGTRLSDLVATHWAKSDFEAAFQWTNSLANPDDRERGILALAKARAQADPLAAATWARDTLQGTARAGAIQDTVVAWVAKDPAAVASWIDKLADPKISDATFDTIAVGWMKKDEAKARQWIATAKVPQQRKDYVEVVARR